MRWWGWGAAAGMAGLAAGGSAQEAAAVEATFAYRSLDLATLEAGAEGEAYALETLLAADPGEGPLAGLRGRCLLLGTRGEGHEAEGRCALSDGAEDRLFLRLAERSAPGGVPEGEGEWAGGTGRFGGAEGRFAYVLVSYALRPAGVMEGTGRLRGTLAVAGGPEPARPEEPPFRLMLPEEP